MIPEGAGSDQIGRGTVSIDVIEVLSGGSDRELTDLFVVPLKLPVPADGSSLREQRPLHCRDLVGVLAVVEVVPDEAFIGGYGALESVL